MEVQKKDFPLNTTKWICIIQLILGTIELTCEICKILTDKNLGSFTVVHTLGGLSLTLTAVWFTRATRRRATHLRLYLTMGLHILNVMIHFLLVEKILGLEVTIIREEVSWEAKLHIYNDPEFPLLKCKYNDTTCLNQYQQKVTLTGLSAIGIYYRLLTLTGIIAICSLCQSFLSSITAALAGCTIFRTLQNGSGFSVSLVLTSFGIWMMMEAEVTGKGKSEAHHFSTSSKSHEHKKYRLRPLNFNNENEIYKKYFQARVAKWISWLQLTVGFTTLATQVTKMIIAQNVGLTPMMHVMGSWGLVMLAAGVTISAAYRSTYCRLHSAMALNILNSIVQYLLVEMLFSLEVPNLRNQLMAETEKYALDIELARIEFSRNNLNSSEFIDWKILEKRDFENFSNFYRMELALVGMISIYGILQILLSFLIILMTGRAICCGRISLERKFYEIENLGSIHDRTFNRPGLITLPDIDEVKNQKCQLHRKESENSESSLTSPCHSPPPYDSTTPRSSEDVTIDAEPDRAHNPPPPPPPSFNIKTDTV